MRGRADGRGVREVPLGESTAGASRAKPCAARYQREYYQQHPDKRWASDLRHRLGIGAEEFDLRLAAQGGVCAICGRDETHTRNKRQRRLCVDHDHQNGKIRGVLCSSCNTALGGFGDDPELLRTAAEYLDEWRRRHG